jgi:hypothetical protein
MKYRIRFTRIKRVRINEDKPLPQRMSREICASDVEEAKQELEKLKADNENDKSFNYDKYNLLRIDQEAITTLIL